MGTSAAETVKEIEDTRDRLEVELRELEERLPKPAVWVKRVAGVAVGGGAAGATFWFLVRRRRKKRAAKVAATRPVQTVIRVLPERWEERVGKAVNEGEWKGWLAMAGGTWIVFRLAELRQLRRMNRAFLAGAGGRAA
jgi:hypothetical protein